MLARLFGKEMSRHIVNRQIDRVAHLYMFGLNSGKHGVSPAKRTAALMLHGCVAEQRLVGELSLLAGIHISTYIEIGT